MPTPVLTTPAAPGVQIVQSPEGRERWLRSRIVGRLRALRNPLYGNGLALVASSGITSLLGFAYWSLAARSSSPAAIGLNSALVAAMVAIANVTQLGLGGGLASYLPGSGRDAPQLVRRAYAAAVVTSLGLALGFVVLAPHFSPALRGLASVPLAIFFVISVVLWSIFGLQDSVLTALRRTVWVPVENAIYGLAKLALVVLLATRFDGYGIFVSWTVPAMVILVPMSVTIFGRFVPRERDRAEHGQTRSVAMPFSRFVANDTIAMVLSQVSTTLLPLLVVSRIGPTEGGHFYPAWMIAQSLDLLAVNLGISLTVEGAHDRSAVRHLLRQLLKRILPLVAAVAAVVATTAPIVLSLFGSDYAGDSVTILRLLVVGSVCRVVPLLCICASRAELAPRRIVRLLALQATILPLSSWVLMGYFGAKGAAMAWIVGQILVATAALRSMNWLRRNRAAAVC